MTKFDEAQLTSLTDRIQRTPRQRKRRLVAIVGAPASGKSTLAEQLSQELSDLGCPSQVVPMDGFHLDNGILSERQLLARKGALETFDIGGLLNLVKRVAEEELVFHPKFDRARDLSLAGAGVIANDCDTIIIEGNYLLNASPIWRELSQYWDLSIQIDIPITLLEERLIKRWLSLGLSLDQATVRAKENDLVNAEVVRSTSGVADITI